MTDQEVQRLLLLMAEVWPSYPLPDPDQLQNRLDAWQLVAGDLGFADAVQAIRLIARDGVAFPPTPGQLVARVRKEREDQAFYKAMGWGQYRQPLEP